MLELWTVSGYAPRTLRLDRKPNRMTRLINFFRSDLFLSLAGGFALGFAAIAFVRPASAEIEQHDSRAVVIESPAAQN